MIVANEVVSIQDASDGADAPSSSLARRIGNVKLISCMFFLRLDARGTDGHNHSAVRLTKKSAAGEARTARLELSRVSGRPWLPGHREMNQRAIRISTKLGEQHADSA